MAAVAAPAAALVAGAVIYGAGIGLAAAIIAALASWALAIRARSALNVAEASQIAQFTSGLANQATVAPTVVEAIKDAAPLVAGRVGQAARTMAEEVWIGSLPEAVDRFAATVRRPLASMCANVLAEAHSGGIQWAQLVNILDTEAAEAAETARHFHRHVGRMMGQIVITLVMAVAVIALTGMLAETAGAWLIARDGQTVLLAAAALLGLLHVWVLGRAQRELR
ncbi:MAG: hypothetical protein F4124_00975 [Acidimicrobiia bacterium]|nr:hypothetical protein [Acidimicrobiia bacterium]MYH97990.1 hypothetical protein [Acidimicrobiia bacterium]